VFVLAVRRILLLSVLVLVPSSQGLDHVHPSVGPSSCFLAASSLAVLVPRWVHSAVRDPHWQGWHSVAGGRGGWCPGPRRSSPRWRWCPRSRVQASTPVRNLGPKIPMSRLYAEAREKSGLQCILESCRLLLALTGCWCGEFPPLLVWAEN